MFYFLILFYRCLKLFSLTLFFCFSDWIICTDLSSSSWTTLSSPAKPIQCIFNFRYPFRSRISTDFLFWYLFSAEIFYFLLIPSIFFLHICELSYNSYFEILVCWIQHMDHCRVGLYWLSFLLIINYISLFLWIFSVLKLYPGYFEWLKWKLWMLSYCFDKSWFFFVFYSSRSLPGLKLKTPCLG